jgi:hypothetical protein
MDESVFYQKTIHGIQIKEMLYYILGISPVDTPCAVTYLEKDTPRGFLLSLTIFFRKTINRPPMASIQKHVVNVSTPLSEHYSSNLEGIYFKFNK